MYFALFMYSDIRIIYLCPADSLLKQNLMNKLYNNALFMRFIINR